MAFYKLRQGKYIKLERYHEIFLSQVEVLDEVGVTIADEALGQHVAQQHGRDEPMGADNEEAKQIALAIQFIKGTNASHKPYLAHLCDSYLDGAWWLSKHGPGDIQHTPAARRNPWRTPCGWRRGGVCTTKWT